MKKVAKIIIALGVIFSSILYVYLTGSIKTIDKSIVSGNYGVIELGAGDQIIQNLVLNEKNPQYITLPLTEKSNYANLTFDYTVIKDNKEVAKGTTSLKDWNGSSEKIMFSPNSTKGIYSLNIKVTHAENNAKLELRTGHPISNEGILTLNQDKQNKSLAIEVKYKQLDWYKLWKAIISSVGALLILAFIGNNVTRNFILISSVMGCLFIVNNPIFEATDEIFHFDKSYDISMGNILSKKQGKEVGVHLPVNIDDMPLPNHFDNKYGMLFYSETYDKAKTEFWDTYHFSNKTKFVEQSTTAVYSPIPYIPQAIGLILARLLGLKALYAVMLSRALNLAVYITLTGLAIHLIPRMKKTLMFLACFPLFISLAASFSADATLMGLTYLFIALLFQNLFKSDNFSLTSRKFLLPALLMILIVLCKFTYWPLSFLMLVFWGRKLFQTKIQGVLSFGLVAGFPAIIMGIWNGFIMKYVTTININDKINPKGQIHYILDNPLDFAKTLFNTFENGMTSWFIMSNQLGWVSHTLNGIVVIGLAGLVITAIFDYADDEWKLRKIDYAIFILIIGSIVGLIMLSLYLTWSEVGNNFVNGIQGRYFLPVIPLILFVLNERFNVFQYSEQTTIKSAKLACCMLLYANLFMVGHFY